MHARCLCAALSFFFMAAAMGDVAPASDEAFFPIGVWFEGKPEWARSPEDPAGASAYYEARFVDLAARGFNTATVTNCPEALWPTLLEVAGRHHIRIVLDVLAFKPLIDQAAPVVEATARGEVARVVQIARTYPALFRYQTRDEPAETMLANWAAINRLVEELDPGHPAFSCFCSPSTMGVALRQAATREAVFDVYPYFQDTPAQSLGSFPSLLDRFCAEAGPLPKWLVLQSFAKPGLWRYPTAEELRAEVYLGLVAGVRGVFFFIYQSLPNHPEGLLGLATPGGAPTPLGEAAAQLAGELRTLAPTLAELEPCSDTALWNQRTHVATSGPFIPNDIKGDVRLSAWKARDGRDVLIMASLRPDRPVPVRVDNAGNEAWADALTGERFQPASGSFSLTLSPGGGKVVARGR